MTEIVLIIFYVLFGVGLGCGLFHKESPIWTFLCILFWPFFLGAFIGIVLQVYDPRRQKAVGEQHPFDPIHNGADECECGLIRSASVHGVIFSN